MENKHSNKHIILEDVTIVSKLKDLKLYINPELYKIAQQAVETSTGELTATNILKGIREDIKQINKPVFNTREAGENVGRRS